MRTSSCCMLVLSFLCAVCGAASALSVSGAKLLPDGSPVTIESALVSYVETDVFYIEEETRASGIRVELAGHGLSVGWKISLTGTILTSADKERYVSLPQITPVGPGSVAPLGLRCSSLGGSDWCYGALDGSGQRGTSGLGLNSVGLLVTVWGSYSKTGATTFTINDGSCAGIDCVVSGSTQLSDSWEFVTATGVCSITYDSGSGTCKPLVRAASVGIAKPEVISKPGIPYGEASPVVLVPYLYSTTGASSNYGHELEYQVNFGDGTTSGWSMFMGDRHAYETTGQKTITITARCKLHPEVSATSDPFVVNVVDGIGWVKCAPPQLGYAISVAFDQQGNAFAGTPFAVYRSTDHGDNWLQMSAFPVAHLWTRSKGCILATGGGWLGYGIRRSRDYGDHWELVNDGLTTLYISSVMIDSSGVALAAGTNRATFRSVDDCSTWIPVGPTLNTSVKAFLEDDSGNVYAGSPDGVFRSGDHGETWTKVHSGGSYSLAISPNGDIFSANSGGGLHRTSDHGEHWTPLGLSDNYPQSVVCDSRGYVYVSCAYGTPARVSKDNGATWAELPFATSYPAAVDNEDRVLILSNGIRRSSDGGDSWVTVGYGIDNADPSALAACQVGVYAGMNGIYRSVDRGDSWSEIGNGSGSKSLAFNQAGHIFSSDTSGIRRSLDQGSSWTNVWYQDSSTTAYPVFVTPAGALVAFWVQHVFYYDYYWRLMRSTDNGNSWMWVTDQSAGNAYRAHGSLSRGPGCIYCFESGVVHRSLDDGLTWSLVGPYPVTMPEDSVAVAPSGDIYALTSGGGALYRSSDAGQHWSQLGVFGDAKELVAIDALGCIYLCGTRVYRSTDSETWEDISAGLPGTSMKRMTFDVDGYAYVGTGNGIYRTTRSTTQ